MSYDPALSGVGKRIGLETWRINKFKLERVPKEQHGVLFTGDSYVFLNTVSARGWDVHFWLGKHSTTDERGTAAIKAVEIDQVLGDFPIQHRETQDHESALFLSYFPNGLRYMEGGYSSGYHHVEDKFSKWTPKLFHCKGKRVVRCTQVPCKKESLNIGDVFLLDLGKTVFVWMPPECGRMERIKGMVSARNIAENERGGKAKVEILDSDWNTDEEFWSYFGGLRVVPTISRATDDDEYCWETTNQQVSLWRVSDATGKLKLTKEAQGDIPQKKLDTQDAFILDAVDGGIFVWIGKKCTPKERSQAMVWAQDYIKQQNRPPWTQVTRVLETAEPAMFTQWFGDWNEGKKGHSFKPRLFQLSDQSGKLSIEEIANFRQESLDGDDVMILDALDLICVWVGSGANQNEREGAGKVAKAFLKQSLLPRRKGTRVETMLQGKESPIFKDFFPSWNDRLPGNDDRSIEDMVNNLFK